MFTRYIGIDYSGASTAISGLTGLRAYVACTENPPLEVVPLHDSGMHWSRRGLAEWLTDRLSEPEVTVVGIDHGLSFPTKYFQKHRLALNWQSFLVDFCEHWPTHEDDVKVRDVREGRVGAGGLRSGDAKWRRLTELRAGGAKSVFHFDVPGAVATSTHAGLPWIWQIRRALGKRLHVWPFDGWKVPKDKSVLAEVYPSLCREEFPSEGRTGDQHDAWSVARWMREMDKRGELRQYFAPGLTESEREIAAVEGWILGVM